jgi:hypothetical protein
VVEATGGWGRLTLDHIVSMPAGLIRSVNLLIPGLQRRGRFRIKCKGRILWPNLLGDE